MKKRNAFTLVELLAVIVILAIVLIIAVPGVLSIINKTKNSAYDRQIDMIKEAARNYVTTNDNQLEWQPLGETVMVEITLQELQTAGYLDKKIVDPRTKKEMTCAITTVTKEKQNKIQYAVDTDNCQPIPESCFTFEKTSGTITGYQESCGRRVTIPKTINGVAVTSIGDQAFYNKELRTITLPEGIQTIGNRAFSYNKIQKVIIPEGVTTINDAAFYHNQLKELVLPTTIKTMPYASFNNNQLPDDQAFIYKRNSDGSEDKTTVISYGGANRDQVSIPSQVQHLGVNSFSYNQLKKVIIPEGVLTISNNAFANNLLETIVLPASLTNVGSSVFRSNRLTDIQFPNKYFYIGGEAFADNQLPDNKAFIYLRNSDGSENKSTLLAYGGAKRDNVVIPENVTNIMNYAFYGNQITSVTIPESVTTIGDSAFYKNKLTTITIPQSVMSLGTTVFEQNPSLHTVVIKGKTALSEFTTVGTNAFGTSNPTIQFER